MKALTLIQPWAWCITHAGKRVENRTWSVGALAVVERLAIHAGLRTDIDALVALAAEGLEPAGNMSLGAVVATAQLVACVEGNADEYRFAQRWASKSVGDFRLRVHRLIRERDGLWFSGPIGWVLDNVLVMPRPIPARGAQGLWTLPPDVAAQVAEQEAEVRRDA
jgi:hypothetical protein